MLHTPPHLFDLLTVEQFHDGCDYIDQVVAARQKANDST